MRRAARLLAEDEPSRIASMPQPRQREKPAAEPIAGFPAFGELLYDIGIVLAVMLGIAALAGAGFQG